VADKGGSALKNTGESPITRVASRDGTEIAYWTTGTGPPLVVVHGGAADHTRWQPLLPHLEAHVTVHAMDRRGRGASGDAPDYDLRREFEDVVAVIDSVARVSGSAVDVYGHSHGGFCAFGAAALTSNIRKLILYEGWPVPDPSVFALPVEVEERMETLLAEGNRGAVVEALFRAFTLMSEEDLAAFRAAPSWQGRVAAAHTITREVRAEARSRLDPQVDGKITVPVLLIVGERSSDPAKVNVEAVASALPDAQILVLDGQEHVADVLAPAIFAQHILRFLHDRP
jgi:pimeloyl-ACP methyl ester carboxylesterase